MARDQERTERLTESEITNAKTKKTKPNILFVQLESYFDVDNAEFFKTSQDVCPNLHKMFNKYSTGYFEVPSVGAGTANTEFEVLTGMNLRYFGPGEYPYKTMLKESSVRECGYCIRRPLGYGTHAPA